MATLICNGTGNLTGSTTFAAAETGTGALNLTRNSGPTTLSVNSSASSPVFTVTTAKVIDGVLLWLMASSATVNGTLLVELQKSSVTQASVTVNCTDLPHSATGTNDVATPVPIFFKFTSTATGDGANTWTIKLTASNNTGSQISYYKISATIGDYTRALRTTTAATPAAADDLYIIGELTGAGTHTSRTVTMDSTAATAYGNGAVNSTSVAGGGIHISNYGTLTYGTSASTAYVLRVNGDLIVYQNGTLNIGVSAAAFNSLDSATASGVTLSNGGLTATYTSGAFPGARSISYRTTGKYYFEVTVGTKNGTQDAVGIITSAASYSDAMDLIQNCAETISNTGTIFSNNGNSGKNIGSWTTGDNISFAVDLDNRKIWFRKNGGNWNGLAIGSENPVGTVGGATIAATVGFAPFIGFNNGMVAGDNKTINFGATAYVYTAPSGFGSWGAAQTEIPRTSTAVLEFQQASADGDFGLRCLNLSVINIAGLSRTSGKNIVQCKLTADVVSSNLISAVTNGGANAGPAALDASGNSLLASSMLDTVAAASHYIIFTGTTVSNTTQTVSVWLARGSGTNNRYVRVSMNNNVNNALSTNGFYSDIDLQAGTAGTVTAFGTGTATSVSITALGTGYLIRMTGKVSSGSAQSFLYLMACSAAGTTSYTGNATQCFIYDHVALVTASSISDTTFNVDQDTGWLSGDAVCVASTTRTASECEIYPLNANAGSTSFTSALYPFGNSSTSLVSTHSGTAPTQAEVGLITRNVKIRSTSTSLVTYVYCTALATVTASWAEFYNIGVSGTANKRGIEIDAGATANAKSFTYCSIHDVETNGIYCVPSSNTSLNLTLSNNILWNFVGGHCIFISSTITNTDWTFDSNLMMRCGAVGFNAGDIGGTFTNNTVVGMTSPGILLSEGATGHIVTLGTFSGNTVHSCTSGGLSVTSDVISGTISNFTAWRNLGGYGISLTCTSCIGLVFQNITLFGTQATSGQFFLSSGDTININGGTIAGDTTFSSSRAINVNPSNTVQYNINNVDMSGVGGIYAPHTNSDLYYGNGVTNANTTGTINNCKFGAATFINSKSVWLDSSYIGFEKYNQVAGDHRTEMTYGQLKTDSIVYNTASPSMKMTPTSASNKLESASKGKGVLAAVANGATLTPAVYVWKEGGYTGNQPRLIVRANPAIGITTDTVLATLSSTGTLPTMFEVATSTQVTMTNSNRILTNTGTTGGQGAHVLAAEGKTSGKYYIEFTLVNLMPGGTGNTAIGVCNGSATYITIGNNATNGAYYLVVNGHLFGDGNASGQNFSAPSNGDVICMAIDLTNYRAWFRINGSGNWNGTSNTTANPATNTGGLTITAGTIVPVIEFGGGSCVAGNTIAANFGATSFAGSVPSGFTSGWPTSQTGIGTATWERLSGTTATVTDDGALEFIVDCDGTSGCINIDDWSVS